MTDVRSTRTIERIDAITKSDFVNTIIPQNTPVVLTNVFSDWKALSLWSPDYFAKTIGPKQVNMVSTETGSFDREKGRVTEPVEIEFGKALDLICNPEGRYHYLQQQPMDQEFPELLPDIRTPDLLDADQIQVTNLWFGSVGNVSPLHYDLANNLFCQVYGRKRFVLYAPEDSGHLYQRPLTEAMPHVSMVDIDRPDFEKFPLLEEVVPYDVTLYPGEALFLPTAWWHHVRSLDMSISVNFWWSMTVDQSFSPNIVRLAPTQYEADRFASVRELFGSDGYGFIEGAEKALFRGMSWLAVLLGAAALEDYLRGICRQHGIEDTENGNLVDLANLLDRLANVAADLPHHRDRICEWLNVADRVRRDSSESLARPAVRAFIDDINDFLVSRRS